MAFCIPLAKGAICGFRWVACCLSNADLNASSMIELTLGFVGVRDGSMTAAIVGGPNGKVKLKSIAVSSALKLRLTAAMPVQR